MLLQLFGRPAARRGLNHQGVAGRLAAAAALGLALAWPAGLRAADEEGPVQFAEGDYAAFSTLRLANAIAQEKLMFAHGNKAKQEAIAAEFAKACADAGWTRERFEQVDEAVGSALGALEDPENASDELSKTTLATVRAHRDELSKTDELQQRARQIMQEQERAARRGAVPTPAQLAGKWIFDLDLTVAAMTEGMPDDVKSKARADLLKSMTAATYLFGPGDRLVATVQRPGVPPETQEGSYRLDGSNLIVRAKMGSRVREDKVDVGLKDGKLQIGMMGIYSVFRRE